jgi:hypothetical protein
VHGVVAGQNQKIERERGRVEGQRDREIGGETDRQIYR